MKGSTGVALGVALGVVFAGAGGYYWLEANGVPLRGVTLASSSAAGSAAKERQPLYYRNPMGLPDTSPVPKKDPMGMDYIPVYAGEESGERDEPAAAGRVRISTEKVQKLGVRTEAAQRRALDRVVRAVGRVEPDERRLYVIAPKFEGYVERLHVNVTGQPIGKGQPLFDVYSPELVSAQREYAIAAQGMEALRDADEPARAGMRQLAEASLARLRNWDISGEQIKALARSGAARRTLTFRSPVAGVVTEKKAVQGMRFMPGETLYQIADLSSVWVIADVFEQDIGLIAPGAVARARLNAYPGTLFEGKVSYVYPTLNAATRTVPVRVELDNPGLLLKPAMFAQLELPVETRGTALTVPASAVIDSGTRQIVLVELGEGRFEPRELRLGARGDSQVEILDGVKEGERVVVAANFLIDAESNLKAALAGLGAAETRPRPDSPAAGAVSHRAEGQIEDIDPASGALNVSHGPVATLNWPAMTMEFKAAHAALLEGLRPGERIAFEFVERGQGEWVITSLDASPEAKPAHAGH
ncbi:MAG: efflux RND transporter periplasmic adaptor subunit [Candidatus Accumulibacter sp.]|jgi:Cu(I)/Ag(I) efflux system membrane fusion protein|nr:efflux RND transporter periplasmic adaptor subunit [Accumulibacter sp.]